MDVHAKAPRKCCLSDLCNSLTLKAKLPNEQIFLSTMFSAIASGGAVAVTLPNGVTQSIQFPSKSRKKKL